MSDFNQTTIDMTPRRGFLRHVGSAAALGLAGLMPGALHAQPAPTRSDGPNWPGILKGRHRQVVDAYEVNSGFPLAFAYTFLAPNESAMAVIILRHGAFPKAPEGKNPFFQTKPGVLLVDDMALDRLLTKGVVFGACNIALQVQSKMLANNAGVGAEEAAKEWTANVIPGITLIPSGTWGVNRAQEAGCSYCAGG